MAYEFNWDSERCWYKTICEKYGTEDCNNRCIRFSEMDYLMYLSNIPKARQMPYKIQPEKQDLDTFLYLNDIKKNIKDFVDSGESLYIYSKNSGNGKAQPITSLVLTENGYTSLEHIKLGDFVFGEDGELHEVIGIFPQGVQPIYKITFSDNTAALCTKEHLWKVHSNSKRWQILTTGDLISRLNKNTLHSKSVYNYRIPICEPIKFKETYVKINPYILGCLLGSYILYGECNYSVKGLCEPHILNYLIDICELNNEYRLECVDKKLGIYNIYQNNKLLQFIPNEFSQKDLYGYLYNSIDIRYELLKSIINFTAKYRNHSKIIRIIGKDLDILTYVQSLVETLGGTLKIEEFTSKIKKSSYEEEDKLIKQYVGYIDMPISDYKKYCSSSIYDNIVKKSRESFINSTPKRFITNIEPVGSTKCVCIKLNSDSELYLTNNCIVTHNTSWAIKMLQEYFNQVWYGNRYRCRGLFIFVPAFLNDIKKNINNPSREFNDFVNRINNADLVVWDDIGANKLTEFDHTQLLSYIDQRILALKCNIYTGNLNQEQLTEALGMRLSSRIWNKSIRVEILGEDRRDFDGFSSTP
jgi:hypothetical protein